MAIVLRIARVATASAIVVAVVSQYVHGSERESFSAANFFSYFTVVSNILLAAALLAMGARPRLAVEKWFSLVRGAATLGITMTGLVYAVLLAPSAADVDVSLAWVDFVLHTFAPIVGFADWMLDPPRRRPSVTAAATWLILPAVWLVYTMIRGPIVDWYPYPFLDPAIESGGSIVVTCVGITVVFVGFAAGLRWWAGRQAPATTA